LISSSSKFLNKVFLKLGKLLALSRLLPNALLLSLSLSVSSINIHFHFQNIRILPTLLAHVLAAVRVVMGFFVSSQGASKFFNWFLLGLLGILISTDISW